MKTLGSSTTLCPEAPPLARTRMADYLELTKPRVAALVLFTVAAGALLASGGTPDLVRLLHTLCGTALVAAGASALNQLLERHSDALMQRTENRPLPAGRLQPLEVLLFGAGLGIAGIVYLALALPHLWTAIVAGITFVSYVFLYTPLKRMTVLNTLVGAVPGALPPVIGWTASGGAIGMEVAALFLIVFLWQVPHFLAIAWIHRDDYARASLRMLPVSDREGSRTGLVMVAYCLALIPISLAPALVGRAGFLYLAGATLLGLGFLCRAIQFRRASSTVQARRVLRASLIYLPAVLLLLLVEEVSTSVALALWK
jgi:protoheme IX farnesyltransferase